MAGRDNGQVRPARCDVPDRLVKLQHVERRKQAGWLV